MPRPKPPEPLKPREVRMSDIEWAKFKQLGGAAWLRRFMGSRPDSYHTVFKVPDFANDAPVNRRRETND